MEKKSADHHGKVRFEVPNTPDRPSRSSLTSSAANFFPNAIHAITDVREGISDHKLYVSNLPETATFGDIENLFPKAVTIVVENKQKYPCNLGTKFFSSICNQIGVMRRVGGMWDFKTAVVEFNNWKDCDEAIKLQKNVKLKGNLLVISPKTSL